MNPSNTPATLSLDSAEIQLLISALEQAYGYKTHGEPMPPAVALDINALTRDVAAAERLVDQLRELIASAPDGQADVAELRVDTSDTH